MLTHLIYLTPASVAIHEKGLVPDVAVEQPEIDFGQPPLMKDATLDKAIEIAYGQSCGLMNKQDLIARIVKDAGVSKRVAAKMLTTALATITRSLKKGDAVTLVGFGTFKTAVRKARTGRNPLTGATIRIPRHKAVRFSAGKSLKTEINSAGTAILFVRSCPSTRGSW